MKPAAAKTPAKPAAPKAAPASKKASAKKVTAKKSTAKKASAKKAVAKKVVTRATPSSKATAPAAARKETKSMPTATLTAYIPVKKDPSLANNWKTKSVEELTDAEVVAMPDEEYMNDTQMAFFRLKLVQLKNGILSNADATTQNLRKDTVVVPDPADRATIEEEHALELRTRDRERKLLKKIEQSIARIDAGDYGYCDETGEEIGVSRLLARPTASLSLEAQQRRELRQKMFGD